MKIQEKELNMFKMAILGKAKNNIKMRYTQANMKANIKVDRVVLLENQGD